jgi:hypothetical protein
MGFVPDGGFAVVTTEGTLVRKTSVDDQTLNKIADILGISKAERDQLIPVTRSITIYRGGKRKRPRKKE